MRLTAEVNAAKVMSAFLKALAELRVLVRENRLRQIKRVASTSLIRASIARFNSMISSTLPLCKSASIVLFKGERLLMPLMRPLAVGLVDKLNELFEVIGVVYPAYCVTLWDIVNTHLTWGYP